jgi:hypothetical protein
VANGDRGTVIVGFEHCVNSANFNWPQGDFQESDGGEGAFPFAGAVGPVPGLPSVRARQKPTRIRQVG